MLRGFTAVLAPILPHMAEDIWQALPYATAQQSVFEAGWLDTAAYAGYPQAERDEWAALRGLRDLVNKVIEEAR